MGIAERERFTFVFSEGARLQSTEEEPSLLPMLLTDIEGARSYAIGVKFTRPFFIQKVVC